MKVNEAPKRDYLLIIRIPINAKDDAAAREAATTVLKVAPLLMQDAKLQEVLPGTHPRPVKLE